MLRSFLMIDLINSRHCDCRVAALLAVTASAAIQGVGTSAWIATACGLAMTGKARSARCC